MRRRTFLATLGATTGLAGCVGALGTASTTSGRTDAGAGLVAVTPDAPPHALRAAVTVTASTGAHGGHVVADTRSGDRGTTSRPPVVVTVAVENNTDARQTYRFGATAPWSELRSRPGADGARAVLAPGGRASRYAATTHGCLAATGDLPRDHATETRTLAPGSTLSGRYALCAATDSSACLPRGTYRWQATDYLGNADWGFTVTLSDR